MVQGNVGRGEDWEIGVSLKTPEKVRKLQMALHAKAKGVPSYRFYLLGRGRTPGCPGAPAQIRTGGITAYGSYFGCLA